MSKSSYVSKCDNDDEDLDEEYLYTSSRQITCNEIPKLNTEFLKNRQSKMSSIDSKKTETLEKIRKLRIEAIMKTQPLETSSVEIVKRRLLRFTSCHEKIASSGYISGTTDTTTESSDHSNSTQSNVDSGKSVPTIFNKLNSSWYESTKNTPSSRTQSIGNLSKKFKHDSIWERYCKILPKAKRLMETKLNDFLSKYKLKNLTPLNMDPCEKFAAQQINEIARSVYIKSLSFQHHFTSDYLFGLNTKIEELLNEATLKSAKEMKCVYEMGQKFNFIISNTARILYCIETNPTRFEDVLKQPEHYMNIMNQDMDLASYLKKALGETVRETTIKSEKPLQQIVVKTENYLPSISIKTKQRDPLPQQNNNENKDLIPIEEQTYQDDYWMPSEKDFAILKLISQGAYGAVYLVRHITTEKRFAMKKINKQHALLKNQVRQVFAERDILSFTENPFVVSMFCSFETKNHFCMVMEYAEGGDCASLLKSVIQFSPEMAKIYIAETLVAVEYIHNYGIIHRDIKPDNLLITSMGHIKLTDFGLSKIGLMNITTQNSKDYLQMFHDKNIQGTPDYIAPEVILNRPYGRMVDYWSIGIVLYEFLVGCTPFYGKNVESLFESIVNSSIEWPQGDETIVEDAQNLIIKLLNKNPSARLGSQDSNQVRQHPFFLHVEWNSLLQTKAEFIPLIENEEDTHNFDTREDRYNHSLTSEDVKNREKIPIDTKDNISEKFTSSTRWFQQELADSKFPEKKKLEKSSSSRLVSIIENEKTIKTLESFDTLPNASPERSRYTDIKDPDKLKKNKFTELEIKSSDDSQNISPVRTRIEKFNKHNNSESLRRSETQLPSINVFKKEKEVEQKLYDNKNIFFDDKPSCETIILEKHSKSNNYGFAIKTIRVNIEKKKLSFLQHTVDNVQKGALADLAGVKQDYIILGINDTSLDGFQHVEVIRLLLSSDNRVKLKLASPESLGIFLKKTPFLTYHMKEDSEYFKKLLANKGQFDIIQGTSSRNTSDLHEFSSFKMNDNIQRKAERSKTIKSMNSPGILKNLLNKTFRKQHSCDKKDKDTRQQPPSSLPLIRSNKKYSFNLGIKKGDSIQSNKGSLSPGISPLVSEDHLQITRQLSTSEKYRDSKLAKESEHTHKPYYRESYPTPTNPRTVLTLLPAVSTGIKKRTEDLEKNMNKDS